MLKELLLEMKYEEEEANYKDFVSFLIDNPNPSDDQIHNLATHLNMSSDELEEKIYTLLSSMLKSVGKSNHIPDEEFDAAELKRGIEIELEHTDDELIAKMIAKDHLHEIPDYYTRLDKMEKEAGIEDEEDYYLPPDNGDASTATM